MTDLEIVKRCAEKMEPRPALPGSSEIWGCSVMWVLNDETLKMDKRVDTFVRPTYNPLTDDAQAMSLVRKFKLHIGFDYEGDVFCQTKEPFPAIVVRDVKDLNRAICEVVARLP